jgi:hypothetical protein
VRAGDAPVKENIMTDLSDMSIDEIIEHQSWSKETLLDLVMEYIGNQGSDDALRDFLAQIAENESYEVNNS